MTHAVDWEDAYRSGRYREYWDLAFASPELAGYLVARDDAHPSAALDLGCGSGKDAVLLASVGYDTTGVDISARALQIAAEHAAEHGVSVTWLRGDVLALPCADESFDLVTDRGCFHHLSPLARSSYAREVDRVMRPGAALLLRGCRRNQFPFVAVLAEDIARSFSPNRFEMGRVIGLSLVTDAGPLAANACVVRKKHISRPESDGRP
jgi:2-polyprenyl-3-methyl-5-hydroxy-6-metoxy-1,4-benzoquinol methylase